MEYIISLTWDDEARVWIAESQELPGLILESTSLDTLMEKVKIAVPELLEAGGSVHDAINMRFVMERQAVVA
ncbi:MAG: DUF1902 domain-containing protein [Spirochaetaceae bacterium]|jgi:predicted RNase H-like HicB family nuclease|nr:DUF1902 domain-containing protein [Spirochaetaceae bacterium]